MVEDTLYESEVINRTRAISELVSHFLDYPDSTYDNYFERLNGGLPGACVHLMNAFAVTHNQSFLLNAEKALRFLIMHCRKNPTPDFSLYNGRGSVVYALTYLYGFVPDKNILSGAYNLILPCKEEYLYSPDVSDSLYDGRAGTLLVLLRLYHLTRKKILLTLIGNFVEKILQNAKLNDAGIRWSRSNSIFKNAPGNFGYGSRGIVYVLQILSSYFTHSGLGMFNELLKEIQSNQPEQENDFAEVHWNTESYAELRNSAKGNCWLDIRPHPSSWKEGICGNLLAELASEHSNSEEKRNQIKNDIIALNSEVLKGNSSLSSLTDGVEGLVMLNAYAFKIIGSEQFLKTAHLLLANQRIQQDSKPFFSLTRDYVQLHVCYAHQSIKLENMFIPSVDLPNSSDPNAQLLPNEAFIKRQLIKNHFPRTLGVWETIHTNPVESYVNNFQEQFSIASFLNFADKRIRLAVNNDNAEVYRRVLEVFSLEKRKLSFGKQFRCSPQNLIDEINQYEKNIQLLNGTEWFSSSYLGLSATCILFETNWNWEPMLPLANQSPVAGPNELLAAERGLYWMLFYWYNNEIQEETLFFPSLIIEHIQNCDSTAEELLEKYLLYLDELKDSGLKKVFTVNSGFIEYEKSRERLPYIFQHFVEKLICLNVLTVLP